MKVAVGVLFGTVLGISAHCYALDYVVIKCNTAGGNCPTLPAAPALPIPPSPPPPPSIFVPPMPPTPVAPPLPSSISEINVAAQEHLACVGKAEGTEIKPRFSNRICSDDGCTFRVSFVANEARIASYSQRRAAKLAENAPSAHK